MRDHYDPGYERSLRSYYPALARARELPLADGHTPALQAAARELLGV